MWDETAIDAWLLRATMDTNYFHRMISAIAEKSDADAYFANRRGVYQSKPRFAGGQLMETSPLADLEVFDGVKFDEIDDHLLMTVWPRNVPWLCTVQMDRSSAFAELRRTRMVGLWVFVLAAILIGMTVLLTTNHLVSRLEVKRRSIRFLDRQLRQSNRLASAMELAIGFFRDVRGALTNIDAAAMSAQELCRGNPAGEISESISQIRQEAARCRSSIDKFVRFTRNGEPIITASNVNEMLDDLLEFMDNELRFNNIRVIRDYGDALPAIRTDPTELRQVF